jgi:hypothetical protein
MTGTLHSESSLLAYSLKELHIPNNFTSHIKQIIELGDETL